MLGGPYLEGVTSGVRTVAEAGRAHLSELSRPECLELLAANRFGRLAVTMGAHAPLIRPINYVFDKPSQSVAFRTGLGTKLHALVRAARAAFEIDEIDPESRTGWSVVIVGVTEQVTNPGDVRRLESHALETWALGAEAQWVRIRAFSVSGRRITRELA